MKIRENDEAIIQKMIEETYRFTLERESGKNSPDLFAYFKNCEKKSEELSSFLLKEQINYFEINYNESNSCFRFLYNNQIFDLPVNWSFFHQIFISWQTSRNDLVVLDQGEDKILFAEVFNLVTPYACDFCFCVSGTKIYFVILPKGKQQLFVEIEKKLGLTVEGPIVKAA